MIGGSDFETQLGGLVSPRRPAPIGAAEYAARLQKAQALTAALGAGALIVGAGDSLRYFTGVPWGGTERLVAMVLPVSGEPVLICPRFELGTLQADLSVPADIRLWEEDEDAAALLATALPARAALDPALPFGFVDRMRRASPDTAFTNGERVIDGCRAIKSPAELALLQQAKDITLEVQRRAARILAPGIRASTVRRFIDEAHRAQGAAGSSFCIVQFGRSTAYPHGLPGDDVLCEGDMVLIDTGCRIGGYHSDITRSYVFGTPDAEQRRIWTLEKAAQQAAFDAVRPGVACAEIDAAARRVLEAGGLGPGYRLPGLPHRTGHGIGLSIHEAPYLVKGAADILAPGMCFSNEPMIVVPDRFGIRLEDHFFVTDTGAQWFTAPAPSIERPV